jgi:hypothetical protein
MNLFIINFQAIINYYQFCYQWLTNSFWALETLFPTLFILTFNTNKIIIKKVNQKELLKGLLIIYWYLNSYWLRFSSGTKNKFWRINKVDVKLKIKRYLFQNTFNAQIQNKAFISVERIVKIYFFREENKFKYLMKALVGIERSQTDLDFNRIEQ